MPQIIAAATTTLGAGGTDQLGSVADGVGKRVLLKVSSSGVFVGQNGIDTAHASGGYELTANKEYTFLIQPSAELLAGSADYSLNIYNSNGTPIVYSYIATLI